MTHAYPSPVRVAAVRALWCCGCGAEVPARLIDGQEAYPRRPDLSSLPFWRCDTCWNFVGCHHKTKNRTRPLGNIPTPELKRARQHIHSILDPLWQRRSGWSRGKVYDAISRAIGRAYHTAEIKTVEDARRVYRIVLDLGRTIDAEQIERMR